MPDLLKEAERSIEHILRPSDSESNHQPNFKDVFDVLSGLHDGTNALTNAPKAFQTALGIINDDLHRSGLLPHLELVMEEDGDHAKFALVQDSKNNQGRAVVSKSSSAPQESPQEKSQYEDLGKQTGYNNGWQDSATGGGGTDGNVNKNAAVANIPESSHKELIKKALQLAGEEPSEANVAAVNLVVEKESSWNPNAINLSDSNATAGHPSQGLMQTIPGTFKDNALPGYDTNINDPLSNLIAGIRYSKKTYGGVQNVPGVQNVANGEGYVGY